MNRYSVLRRLLAGVGCWVGLCVTSFAFEITNLQFGSSSVTISWEGGSPPYQVQESSDLIDWNDVGDETNDLSMTFASSGSSDDQKFFRVRGGSDPVLSFPIELALGSFSVAQFSGPTDPNFHLTKTLSGTVPASLPDTKGHDITIELYDLDHPNLVCFGDHPTNGCTTIDWDDFDGRPNVPEDNYFDNSITLELAGVETKLFMRRVSFTLSTVNNSHPIG